MGAAEAMTTASRPGLCPWGHQGACVSRGPGWGRAEHGSVPRGRCLDWGLVSSLEGLV